MVDIAEVEARMEYYLKHICHYYHFYQNVPPTPVSVINFFRNASPPQIVGSIEWLPPDE